MKQVNEFLDDIKTKNPFDIEIEDYGYFVGGYYHKSILKITPGALIQMVEPEGELTRYERYTFIVSPMLGQNFTVFLYLKNPRLIGWVKRFSWRINNHYSNLKGSLISHRATK